MNNPQSDKYMLYQMYGCVVLFVQSSILFLFDSHHNCNICCKIGITLGLLGASFTSIYLIFAGNRGYKSLYVRFPVSTTIIDCMSKIIVFVVVNGSLGWLLKIYLPFFD